MANELLFPDEGADIVELTRALSNRGRALSSRIRDLAAQPNKEKTLRLFGTESAARLIGVSGTRLRELEKLGRAAAPQTSAGGKRGYTLANINAVRDELGRRPSRPTGCRAKVVSVTNQKGGAGKSSTSVHFSQYCALKGYRVLLVDTDPQASTTMTFGYVPGLDLSGDDTLFDALLNDSAAIRSVVRKTYWDGLDLIPAELELQAVDMLLPGHKATDPLGPNSLRLRRALELVMDDYDVIVVDSPPSLTILSLNTVLAADLILIPIPPAMYEISSTISFLTTLASVLDKVPEGHRPTLLRMLVTKHDGHVQSQEMEGLIRTMFGGIVLNKSMMMTDEINKSGSDLQTVYELERPRGARATFVRALTLLDGVNEEILQQVEKLWRIESSSEREKAIA